MLKAEPRREGRHLLIPIKGSARLETSAGAAETRVSGELVVELRGDDPGRQGVRLVRFGLAASGVEAGKGPTGTITILGDEGSGIAIKARAATQLEIELPGRINYESLDRAHGRPIDKGCYYQPAFEPCSTRVSLDLAERQGSYSVRKGRLITVCAAHEFEEVLTLEVDLSEAKIRPVRDGIGEVHFEANTPFDPCIGVNRRVLTCRPVAFRANAGDANPSGSTIAAQFATAQTVWAKACIDITVLPTQTITDATLKTSSNLMAIRNSFTDGNPDVIEVYFVDNLLTSTGGGNAGAIGVASCKVVIAEPNAGNPVLLAHELGHVLGLLHPPGSDAGSVMQPTGGANNPGTPFVTFTMAQNIANPVLATTTPCCLGHDKGDHYIKDFPVDPGAEPSDPLPAGMTRYSMSNVWNRRTNTPGPWSIATGPDHQSPYRFENDGVTPATNYFYARVEQLNTFSVGAAAVKFYLKTPGSGGGAGNLTLLGSANVPAGLAVGVSRDAVLTWQVPAGTPSHSCCFAVVHSPAEPEGTPAMLTWAQFEDMGRQDNDWAQRNLDILDVQGNTGFDGVYESAPWIIDLPKEGRQGRLPLTLMVTPFGDVLTGAEVEIGGEVHKVKPGKPVRLTAKRPVVPGEPCPVILRASLRAGARRGAQAGLLIDPVLGETPLTGFGTGFRLAGSRLASRMLLDRALAAAWDVADLIDGDEWHELAAALRRLLADGPAHLSAVADGIRAIGSLEACVRSASTLPGADRFGLAAAGKRLLEAKGSAGQTNAALASFLGRAHAASAEAGQSL